MALERRRDRSHSSPPRRGLLTDLRRKLSRADRILESALDDLDRAEHALATGAPLTSGGAGLGRPRPPEFLPVATSFICTRPDRVAFVVCGVEYQVELSPLRFALVVLLGEPTRESPDRLVGFKTVARVVHALRRGAYDATRRSVTVEVGRVRDAFGPINRWLIETRPGAGYRFRVLRSVTAEGAGASWQRDE